MPQNQLITLRVAEFLEKLSTFLALRAFKSEETVDFIHRFFYFGPVATLFYKVTHSPTRQFYHTRNLAKLPV